MTASYIYFKIKNLDEEKRRFLSGEALNPDIGYAPTLEDKLKTRLEQHDSDSRARYHLELVLAAMSLRQKQTPEALVGYRQANTKLYTEPRESDALHIFHRARKKITPKTEVYWAEIEKIIGVISTTDSMADPSPELMYKMRDYLRRYTVSHTIQACTLHEALEHALIETGLTQKDWRVVTVPGSRHATTYHKNKTINVGKLYTPRTQKSIMQIVLHEVYGHALRGQSDSELESEGFATLLEQLIDGVYTTKRSYRFLAAAIGWGVFNNTPHDFREVYEVIWRLMIIHGRYDEMQAKSHAFDECVRVFRGGVPRMAGSVYLKDTVYYMGNVLVWQKFSQITPTYEQFVDMLEGRKKVI